MKQGRRRHTRSFDRPVDRAPGSSLLRRLLGLPIGVLLAAFPGPAAANSCLVPAGQLAEIRDRGAAEQINAREAVLRPCRGTPSAASVPVIYSVGSGITRELVADPGMPIAKLIERALKPGQRLEDVWQKGSVLDVLFASLRGERVQLSGSRRMESAGNFPIEGEVLAGWGLRLNLAFHGWSPAEVVKVAVGRQSADLRPVNGQLIVPAHLVQPTEIVLSQSGRIGRLLGVRGQEFSGLEEALAELGRDTGARAPVRRALLFSGNGLSLNALAEINP